MFQLQVVKRHKITCLQPTTIKAFQQGFEKPVYWNEYKTKSENENTANEYRYFIESFTLQELIVVCFSLFKQLKYIKKYSVFRYYLPKGITDNYNVIINEKNFHNQPMDADIK